MSGLSKHLAMAVYNMAFNPVRSAYTPPESLWVSLHTAAPDDSVYGNEANYLGYARAEAINFTALLVAGAGGEVSVQITNGKALTFPASTGPVDQTITHWAIWDLQAISAGNILVSGALGASRVVAVGDAVVLPQGSLVITIA